MGNSLPMRECCESRLHDPHTATCPRTRNLSSDTRNLRGRLPQPNASATALPSILGERDLGGQVDPGLEQVDGPAHYGGKDNPYEAIKVIRAWGLDFWLGNTVKYISRAGKKGGPDKELEDLRKARWYLDDRIKELEENEGGD